MAKERGQSTIKIRFTTDLVTEIERAGSEIDALVVDASGDQLLVYRRPKKPKGRNCLAGPDEFKTLLAAAGRITDQLAGR